MKLSKSLLVLGAIALGLASKVSAVSYNANTDGTSAPLGVTFTGYYDSTVVGVDTKQSGDKLWTVLGVAGGTAGNEIGPKEKLHVEFSQALNLSDLRLGLLFDGSEYYDHYEIAVVQSDGSLASYKLTATGTSTATWTGMGSVTNIAPAISMKGAVWDITNPFGSSLITGFWLYPDQANVRKGDNSADFGLQAFTAPDAASSFAIFGAALLGLGLIRRRK